MHHATSLRSRDTPPQRHPTPLAQRPIPSPASDLTSILLESILLELSGNPDIIMEANTGLWYNLSQPEKIR
ncbi:hypothetical protein LUM42_02210 [Vibrio furnissii]|nr:hypothetical protein [Vibrio furnissii]UHJ60634.1 hypothetical protein LUM42_02210 [Vibrio furnissii]